jgi:hypothetical protein
MTDHDLATLLRDHVREQEPPFLLSPETPMALGRRTLVRRRARRGFAGVLIAAAAVAAIPLLPWGGGSGADDRRGIDPATAAALEHYDAQAMPDLIDGKAREALGDGLSGLGAGKFTANDDQGVALPPQYYDKASGMEVTYGGNGDRRVRVALMHSGSEAEGDARKNCANDLAAGYDFSCEVRTSPNGDVVTIAVMAVRPLEDGMPGWGALTREELRTGIPVKGDPSQKPIDPDEVYFIRNVESVHSDTFLTSVQETVKAPSLAKAAFAVSSDRMIALVTDPSLVIPKPPMGDNGCAWMLHPKGISCGVKPS